MWKAVIAFDTYLRENTSGYEFLKSKYELYVDVFDEYQNMEEFLKNVVENMTDNATLWIEHAIPVTVI